MSDTNGSTNGAPKAPLKELFAKVSDAESTVAEADAAAELARKSLSDALKAVLDAHGAGPYRRDGREVTIVKRGETYFMKGPKRDREAIEV